MWYYDCSHYFSTDNYIGHMKNTQLGRLSDLANRSDVDFVISYAAKEMSYFCVRPG